MLIFIHKTHCLDQIARIDTAPFYRYIITFSLRLSSPPFNVEYGNDGSDKEDKEKRCAGHEIYPALRLVRALSGAECRTLSLFDGSRVRFQKTTLEPKD